MINTSPEAKKLLKEAAGIDKDQKPIHTASFEDLVDIVLNDDNIKFLLANGEVLDQR